MIFVLIFQRDWKQDETILTPLPLSRNGLLFDSLAYVDLRSLQQAAGNALAFVVQIKGKRGLLTGCIHPSQQIN